MGIAFVVCILFVLHCLLMNPENVPIYDKTSRVPFVVVGWLYCFLNRSLRYKFIVQNGKQLPCIRLWDQFKDYYADTHICP
jgi:hypothetical protein